MLNIKAILHKDNKPLTLFLNMYLFLALVKYQTHRVRSFCFKSQQNYHLSSFFSSSAKYKKRDLMIRRMYEPEKQNNNDPPSLTEYLMENVIPEDIDATWDTKNHYDDPPSFFFDDSDYESNKNRLYAGLDSRRESGQKIKYNTNNKFKNLASQFNKQTPQNIQFKMESLEELEKRLESIKDLMFSENNNQEFNPNSHKQISKALFDGNPNEPTNKDALEALASGGNKLADAILQYKNCLSKMKYLKRQEERELNIQKQHQLQQQKPKDHSNAKSYDDPLMLIDASAFIFRAYHSMPPIFRHDGTPTGAVLGVCNILNRILLTPKLNSDPPTNLPPRVILCFDAPKSSSTFRHELYKDYKSNRPPCPIDLVPQFDLVKDAAEAYGIPIFTAPIGYEADDVIASFTGMFSKDFNIKILSGDKDLMQLVTSSGNVVMMDPFTQKEYNYNEVKNKFGVEPWQIGDVLALAGDAADSVPGVPGIGIKTATSLIQEYHTLQNLLDSAQDIKQAKRRENLIEFKDIALLSRELVELKNDVPILDFSQEHLRMQKLDTNRLLDFYEKMGFKDMIRRMKHKLNADDKQGVRLPVRRVKKTKLSPEDEQEYIKNVPF